MEAILGVIGALVIIAVICAVGFMGEPKAQPPVKAKKPRAPRKPKLVKPDDLKE